MLFLVFCISFIAVVPNTIAMCLHTRRILPFCCHNIKTIIIIKIIILTLTLKITLKLTLTLIIIKIIIKIIIIIIVIIIVIIIIGK